MVRRWRWSTSKRVQRVLSDCMKPAENGKFFFNRNPRNLEMMKIAERPDGYHIDAPGRNYWNKLVILIRFIKNNGNLHETKLIYTLID